VSTAVPLETCETINYSWGFNINDKGYKSVRTLIQYLVKAAGHNANFLLNVGPQADGKIQQEFVDSLKMVGEWLQKNGESIYGTRGGVMPTQEWGTVVSKDKKLFVHILNKPSQDFILLPKIDQKVQSIQLFSSKQPLKWKQQAEGVFVYLNGISIDNVDEIVEVTLK